MGLGLVFVLWMIWLLLDGSLQPLRLLLGLVLSGLVAFASRQQLPKAIVRPLPLLRLMIVFAIEIISATLQVAMHIVRPTFQFRPAIIAYRLRATTPTQISALVNLLTLTPGALVISLSKDRQVLFVHVLDGRDPERTRRQIAMGLERRIIEALE